MVLNMLERLRITVVVRACVLLRREMNRPSRIDGDSQFGIHLAALGLVRPLPTTFRRRTKRIGLCSTTSQVVPSLRNTIRRQSTFRFKI